MLIKVPVNNNTDVRKWSNRQSQIIRSIYNSHHENKTENIKITQSIELLTESVIL